ncbi:Ig-like domain-containing protein [Nocardioides sp. YIM 152315]|uniref:L,D-transpeptidase n=1 Tax=Nocardioides sp. YIM 152315 TaxID=3031760 RepID=UPI0023DB059D|nr:Ig-like domain-containing protein [Nocardioides sp. YIM 152315]MDF1602690.1 Ig-like domain-containing protein [Nocardioides sp. YIM 152315]
MSVSRTRLSGAVAVLLVASAGLSACNADDVPGASAVTSDDGSSSAEPTPEAAPFTISANVRRGATDVPVDTSLSVTASGGTISSVSASSSAGDIPGDVAADGTSWQASGLLEPGATYVVKATGQTEAGDRATRKLRFTTQDLTLDEQTYASLAPLDGETVGVGMPVIVSFDVPVKDKAAFEKHMDVTSTPTQPGAWHWLSDNEAHWRPKKYWQAGTDVHVDIDVNSIPAGNGVYGQESRELDFHVGDAHISRVDMQTHQMKVFSNGKLLRTIPITTGKQPAFTTRSGVKVIIEKFESKDMNSETVGITGAEAYNIAGVKWAMRLTYSGEFIHAAPWSVGSQGYANVSHGCTGMSTENAGWLYAMSRRGDVVEYTGSSRPMTLDNGYGDWNASFKDYKQGSALA